MSDHIPVEIVTSILNKVTDVKDLLRCRLVSKQWLSIIDSDDFIKSHLRRSKAASSNLGLFIVESATVRSLFSPDDIALGIDFRPHPMVEKHLAGSRASSMLVGCCHGLIFYWLPSCPTSQLFILNPSTREGYYVSSNIDTNGSESLLGYGFGYNTLSDDYIAVIINSRYFVEGLCDSVAIHCVRAGCYRNVNGNITDNYISILWECDALMVKTFPSDQE